MQKNVTKKMALTAMLACLAFVLNTFVYFPAMAPFQPLRGCHCSGSGGTLVWICGSPFMRHYENVVRPYHSGSYRSNLWTDSGRPDLQEDKKYLSGMDWRSHRNPDFSGPCLLIR